MFQLPGGTDMFEKMNGIREKQEQLAKLQFELDLQQDMRRLDCMHCVSSN